MGDLSPHFSRREFACKHCGRSLVSPGLIQRLERLRAIVGAPLIVLSGYRCPEHNAAVGGARRSYHMRGMAVDLRRGYADIDDALAAGFTGIGTAGGSAVHVDTRLGQVVIFPD